MANKGKWKKIQNKLFGFHPERWKNYEKEDDRWHRDILKYRFTIPLVFLLLCAGAILILKVFEYIARLFSKG